MRATNFTLWTLPLAAAAILCGCGAAPNNEGSEQSQAALESAASVLSERCGVNGDVDYEQSCADLQQECSGDFVCADERPSSDGSCSTWGECVATPAGESAPAKPKPTKWPNLVLKQGFAEEVECEIAYGPVIKVGSGDSELVTYGPIITIKPKGLHDNSAGYECSVKAEDVVLERAFHGPSVDAGLECPITYGPVITIKPKGLTEERPEGLVTHGPVITIKPKGATEGEAGIDCPVRYGDFTLKRGVSAEGAEVELECNTSLGPLMTITPRG